jgi:hypothetical protein
VDACVAQPRSMFTQSISSPSRAHGDRRAESIWFLLGTATPKWYEQGMPNCSKVHVMNLVAEVIHAAEINIVPVL